MLVNCKNHASSATASLCQSARWRPNSPILFQRKKHLDEHPRKWIKKHTWLATLVTQSPSGTRTSCARDRMTNRLNQLVYKSELFWETPEGLAEHDSAPWPRQGAPQKFVSPHSSSKLKTFKDLSWFAKFAVSPKHCDMTWMLSSLLDLAGIKILNLRNAGNAPHTQL